MDNGTEVLPDRLVKNWRSGSNKLKAFTRGGSSGFCFVLDFVLLVVVGMGVVARLDRNEVLRQPFSRTNDQCFLPREEFQQQGMNEVMKGWMNGESDSWPLGAGL